MDGLGGSDHTRPPLIPASILVVEDDVDVKDVAVELLELVGYVTHWAASATEALGKLEQISPIDIVFSDIRLGQEDGVWLAEQIEAKYPSIHVVLTTGYAMETQARGRNRWPVVLKPYNTRTLIGVFDRVMVS